MRPDTLMSRRCWPCLMTLTCPQSQFRWHVKVRQLLLYFTILLKHGVYNCDMVKFDCCCSPTDGCLYAGTKLPAGGADDSACGGGRWCETRDRHPVTTTMTTTLLYQISRSRWTHTPNRDRSLSATQGETLSQWGSEWVGIKTIWIVFQ